MLVGNIILEIFNNTLVKPPVNFPVLVEGFLDDSTELSWNIGVYHGIECDATEDEFFRWEDWESVSTGYAYPIICVTRWAFLPK